jgi:FtsH-binding integral membrane protein
MNRLKKICIRLVLVIGLLIASSAPALAVNPVQQVCQGNANATVCEASSNNNSLLGKNGIITKAAKVMVYFAGVIAVIMLAIGGIKYTTSQGNPNELQSAKSTIIFALVGLIIAIFAQALVFFVLSKL